jgi:hypothetical protein
MDGCICEMLPGLRFLIDDDVRSTGAQIIKRAKVSTPHDNFCAWSDGAYPPYEALRTTGIGDRDGDR